MPVSASRRVTLIPDASYRSSVFLLGQLVAELRPALEATGDWALVTELTNSDLVQGSSAARQRAAHATGGLGNVVDTLIAETRATPPSLRATGPARTTVSAGL